MHPLTAEQKRAILRRDEIARERQNLVRISTEPAAVLRMVELNQELSYLNRQLGVGVV